MAERKNRRLIRYEKVPVRTESVKVKFKTKEGAIVSFVAKKAVRKTKK